MKKYEVIINGENFMLLVDGEVRKMGFYVTRYVEAGSLEEAEGKAMRSVERADSLEGIVRNSDNNPPMMFVDELYEIESFEDLESLEPGFAFYSDESD